MPNIPTSPYRRDPASRGRPCERPGCSERAHVRRDGRRLRWCGATCRRSHRVAEAIVSRREPLPGRDLVADAKETLRIMQLLDAAPPREQLARSDHASLRELHSIYVNDQTRRS